jgi:hypothetical protein
MAKTVRVWRGPIRDGESEAFPKRNHGKFKNLREPSEQENSRDLGVSRFAAFFDSAGAFGRKAMATSAAALTTPTAKANSTVTPGADGRYRC